MPSTTPERAARWPGGDDEATQFLHNAGYQLLRSWCWRLPSPTHVPTERENDAITYLFEEWDYGGLEGE